MISTPWNCALPCFTSHLWLRKNPPGSHSYVSTALSFPAGPYGLSCDWPSLFQVPTNALSFRCSGPGLAGAADCADNVAVATSSQAAIPRMAMQTPSEAPPQTVKNPTLSSASLAQRRFAPLRGADIFHGPME